MSTPPPRWKSAGNGWGRTLLFFVVLAIGVLAPIVAILALTLGWGTPAVLGAVAVTVLFWAGIAVLVGPVYRRVVGQGAVAESAEIAKLPGLAARYGLSYVEHDDQLPQVLARHAPTRGRCSHVLSGRVDGQSMAVCWYERTQAGIELSGMVLAVLLPAAMPDLSVQAKLATIVAPGTHRQQVQFEDDAFNNRYDVVPVDHSPESGRYAVDLISQPAIDWLLTVEPFSFTIKGELLWVEGSSVLAADEVQKLLDNAVVLGHVVAGVPDFVWKQYGSAPNSTYL